VKAKLLLVEDEEGLVLTLNDLLVSEGYEVACERDGISGERRAIEEPFDLMLLDLNLPGKNGFDILKDIRARSSSLPVLILTARSATADKVVGLRLGADDYLGKPFDSLELLARIEALLRRSGHQKIAGTVTLGDIVIDLARASISKAGQAVQLTAQEWRLLSYLIAHPGETVPRERLLEDVWRYATDISSRTVDVHIASLRQKLEANPASPVFLLTVRGLGYRLELAEKN
jgi:two-component system, OmpR family, alkaline phosphatase synthesis response regulator PhoP